METFRRGWWGWLRSSEGYSVRMMGRTKLQYEDEYGRLEIPSDDQFNRANEIIVGTGTIPDTRHRPKALVIDRLQRAFAHEKWTFIAENDPRYKW